VHEMTLRHMSAPGQSHTCYQDPGVTRVCGGGQGDREVWEVGRVKQAGGEARGGGCQVQACGGQNVGPTFQVLLFCNIWKGSAGVVGGWGSVLSS
jgi:hypothetical protein